MIYLIMGKSASGKDTIYKKIVSSMPELKTIIPYTTRPMRPGEEDGINYHFIDAPTAMGMIATEDLLDVRRYDTIKGEWTYFFRGDEIEPSTQAILIGTPRTMQDFASRYPKDVVPIMVQVDDEERLLRAISRESEKTKPDYRELCRRFLADDEDFKCAEEIAEKNGITIRYFSNKNLEKCVEEIVEEIKA